MPLVKLYHKDETSSAWQKAVGDKIDSTSARHRDTGCCAVRQNADSLAADKILDLKQEAESRRKLEAVQGAERAGEFPWPKGRIIRTRIVPTRAFTGYYKK